MGELAGDSRISGGSVFGTAGEGERRRMRDVIHQSELILHDCICANGQNQCVGTAVGPDVSEENRCAEKARPMCTDTVARTYSPGAKCSSRAAAKLFLGNPTENNMH